MWVSVLGLFCPQPTWPFHWAREFLCSEPLSDTGWGLLRHPGGCILQPPMGLWSEAEGERLEGTGRMSSPRHRREPVAPGGEYSDPPSKYGQDVLGHRQAELPRTSLPSQSDPCQLPALKATLWLVELRLPSYILPPRLGAIRSGLWAAGSRGQGRPRVQGGWVVRSQQSGALGSRSGETMNPQGIAAAAL